MRTVCKLFLKAYLFFFNVFLWLVAVGILGGVGYYFSTTNQFSQLASDKSVGIYTIVPLVIIVLVALMLLLLSVLGLIGACCDVKVLITLYGILLFIVVSAQVAGGVLVVVFRDPVLDELKTGFNKYIKTYNSTPVAVRDAIDSIQKELKCCGVDEPSDWKTNAGFTPESCCKITDCDTSNADNIYDQGCIKLITDAIIQSTSISISIAVLLALIQYSGVAVAFILACCCWKKDGEELIEAKRMLPNY